MRKYDTHWNYISSVEMMNWKTKFVLFLKDQGKRELWVLSADKKILEVKRDPNRHTMMALDAYWFNDTLLRQLDPNTKVVVKQTWTKLKLTTTIEMILKKWTYKFFLTEWFERQIFLKKSDFRIEI